MTPSEAGVQPLLADLKKSLAEIIEGQDSVIDNVIVSLAAGGHALIEGVPGVAKTLLARSLASAVRGSFSRIQFTPDLMPADITGVNVSRKPRNSVSGPDRYSPTWSWPMKSIAPPPRRKLRFSKPCRKGKSPSTARRTSFHRC